MKKRLFLMLILAVGLFTPACAQNDRIRFDTGIGYPLITKDSNKKGDYLISIELKYSISDRISLGFLSDVSSVRGRYRDSEGVLVEKRGKAQMSFLFTGDYYPRSRALKPFIGAGLGYYIFDGKIDDTTTESKDGIGGMFRIGLEYKWVRLSSEYNLTAKVDNVSFNYIGFKLSVILGADLFAMLIYN